MGGIANTLSNFWSWLKGSPPAPVADTKEDIKPVDTKPEADMPPNDDDAYNCAGLLLQAFDAEAAEAFQILPGGVQPADEPRTLKTLPALPKGWTSHVDVYDGPRGKGFVIVYEAGGKRKSINLGPETEREQDWTEIPKSPMP